MVGQWRGNNDGQVTTPTGWRTDVTAAGQTADYNGGSPAGDGFGRDIAAYAIPPLGQVRDSSCPRLVMTCPAMI